MYQQQLKAYVFDLLPLLDVIMEWLCEIDDYYVTEQNHHIALTFSQERGVLPEFLKHKLEVWITLQLRDLGYPVYPHPYAFQLQMSFSRHYLRTYIEDFSDLTRMIMNFDFNDCHEVRVVVINRSGWLILIPSDSR